MKMHAPSFVLGCAVGAGTTAMVPRLRPLALETLTILYRLADEVTVRVARGREHVEDLFAEARDRARGFTEGFRAPETFAGAAPAEPATNAPVARA